MIPLVSFSKIYFKVILEWIFKTRYVRVLDFKTTNYHGKGKVSHEDIFVKVFLNLLTNFGWGELPKFNGFKKRACKYHI